MTEKRDAGTAPRGTQVASFDVAPELFGSATEDRPANTDSTDRAAN